MADNYTNITALTEFLTKVKSWTNNKFATKAVVSSSNNGLMSSSDKEKLDGIAEGATANIGTITGIKMNGASKGSSGVVDLGTVLTSHQDISGKANKSDLATVATSGSYADLSNKPGNASTSAAGFMSSDDKTKLNGIAAGAEVNQNAFSNVVVGSTTISADGKTDSLTLAAGSNVTLTPDATNDKVTIAATNTWRGIQNNLTSDSTSDSLAAAQGKALKALVDGKANASHTHSADNILGGYLNIHPENSPTLIPFMNNDIAYLLKRGGSAIVKYDSTTQSIDISNCFDASPSYWAINPTGITTIVIELTLHKVFAWTNTIYVDFGSGSWRSTTVKIEAMNSNYSSDTWAQKYNNTNNGSGHCYVITSHTPVGASNAGGGFNKLRFTFSSWATATIFRIAQLGIYNYGSSGLRETFLPRDGGQVYGPIQPASNNGANLGSTSNYWGNAYITNINGVAVGSSPKFTDTTYESKAAASGGTAVSLVTTGEKATWNAKTSNTGTVTSVATGVGLTGGTITGSGTVKAKLKSETASTLDSAAMGSTSGRQYAVGVDKSGYLSVNVPWTDTNTQTITGVKGNSESTYRTGNVNLTAANIGAAAASHTHGNIQNGGTLQTNDVAIASGDKLVITDSSDSNKVARSSLSFDGSTTTQFLSKKGTFETPTVSVTITEDTEFNINGTVFKITTA